MVDSPLLSQLRIGEVIRILRKRTPLTVEQLAADVGVSAASVSGYERGSVVPGLLVLRRIIRVLAPHLDASVEALWREIGQVLSQSIESEGLAKRLAQWGVPVIENRVLLERSAERLDREVEAVWDAYGAALDAIEE